MHSSAGTINPTRDFSIRAAGRPLSGKRRPPHSAVADSSPPAAQHHHSPPATTTYDDIPQNYKPLLGRQIVLSVGEALSHPSAVDLRIRTNREALVSAHRARQAAEENKKILEKQCSDLQQLHEDERRRSAEQHSSSITRPNSAVRLTRAGISSNNSTFKMDDTTGNHSAATISFSRPSSAVERRTEDATAPRRPYSAVQRSNLGRALTGPELVLKTMQLETSEGTEQRGGAYIPRNISRPNSAQTQRHVHAATSAYQKRYYAPDTNKSNNNTSPRKSYTSTDNNNNNSTSRPATTGGFDARMGLVVAAHIGSRLGNLGEDADDEEKVLSMFLSDKNDAASRPPQLPDDIRCYRRTNLPGTTGDGLYVAMDASRHQTPALALLSNSLRTTDDGSKWQQYVASIPCTTTHITQIREDGSPMRTMVAEGGKFPHSQMSSMIVGRGMEIGNSNNPSRPQSAVGSRPGSAITRQPIQHDVEDSDLGIAIDTTPRHPTDESIPRAPSPFDNPPPRRTTRPQTAGPTRKAHSGLSSIRSSGPDYVYQPPPAKTVEESRQRLQQALQQKEERLLSNNRAAPQQQQRPYSAQVRPRADQAAGVVDLNLTATSDLASHDNPHGNTSLLGGRFVARSQRTQFGSRPPSAGARRTTSSGSLRSAGGNMFPANPRPGNEIRVGSGFVVYPKV